VEAVPVSTGVVVLGEKREMPPFVKVALATRPGPFAAIIPRSTLSRLVANPPVMFLGDAVDRRVRLRAVRGVAAASLAALAVLNAFNIGDLI
jgi:putative Ca2+/H+ antiporter (TMEM165/GDT1 family)